MSFQTVNNTIIESMAKQAWIYDDPMTPYRKVGTKYEQLARDYVLAVNYAAKIGVLAPSSFMAVVKNPASIRDLVAGAKSATTTRTPTAPTRTPAASADEELDRALALSLADEKTKRTKTPPPRAPIAPTRTPTASTDEELERALVLSIATAEEEKHARPPTSKLNGRARVFVPSGGTAFEQAVNAVFDKHGRAIVVPKSDLIMTASATIPSGVDVEMSIEEFLGQIMFVDNSTGARPMRLKFPDLRPACLANYEVCLEVADPKCTYLSIGTTTRAEEVNATCTLEWNRGHPNQKIVLAFMMKSGADGLVYERHDAKDCECYSSEKQCLVLADDMGWKYIELVHEKQVYIWVRGHWYEQIGSRVTNDIMTGILNSLVSGP